MIDRIMNLFKPKKQKIENTENYKIEITINGNKYDDLEPQELSEIFRQIIEKVKTDSNQNDV